MNILGSDAARGDFFALKATNNRHMSEKPMVPNGEKSFGQLMFDSLNDVNDKQQQYADLSIMAVTDPDSVDAHDVTIAGAEASMSLNIARNVIDRVVRAYRDITTLR